MRILISNDDGIGAAGIRALCLAVSKDAQVTVVAPHQERSASSHGISIHRPLRVEKMEVPGASEAYKTSGTPVDCVKWALAVLHRERPFDLMLSGINAGANLATDVLYSGTVAAAGEASLQGLKSIAFSLVGPPFTFNDNVIKATYDMYQVLKDVDVPADTFLSVNLPPSPNARKYAWTTLGVRKYHDEFASELDENGVQVYRYGGDIVDERETKGTDVAAVRNGYISITPLRYRFTNEEYYKQIKQ
ncbi:5'/3'-nucleotidase SurE [Alicyclobacillus dauci]|uniref:5'-nucleotidase SurE n=1 Tax=Alicyclobacillus dauci TaxID=1475485 RepID=A0ABY6YX42_9BACL|nr:5'/3'-nucleotidase SurE [Alicyclobacillus dauci]WAH35149.1 5'/3'-nucleotidase SurE [Alicyclobacillus dauci]